jgi:hypothetical protein
MDRVTDEARHQSLNDLALRMTAYRERALAARCLADAITDKHATTGLLAQAEAFEKKAEEIAAQIVLLAHTQNDRNSGDGDSTAAAKPPTRPKFR